MLVNVHLIRGKEGKSWCRKPVRAALSSGLGCVQHGHLRLQAANRASAEQRRYMLLDASFYDAAGELDWKRVLRYDKFLGCE